MGVGGSAVRSIVVGLATALVGCASEPPPRPQTAPLQPLAGEEQKAIAKRAFAFVAVYQFEFGGHRYSLGNASDAQQRDTYSELVFIDGQFACARERSMATLSDLDSELTQWERVAEPGGLEHLAEQLRKTCESGQVGPPGASSQIGGASGISSNAESGTAERPAGSPSDAELAAAVVTNGAPFAVADPRLLIVAPLVLLAVGISNAVETAAAKTAAERDAKWRAATITEEVMQLLGEPMVEFSLPDVNTKVMAYRLDEVHPYYVGLTDDKPVWFHKEYPWLRELAKQALAQQEQAKKQRR
jgi:hypothetical protein